MAATTYYVSRIATVKRLDNLTGSWIDVSVPPSIPSVFNYQLLDVKTNPTNPAHVFVGGDIYGGTLTALFTSYNSGATWFAPGGTITTKSLNVYELWPVNSTTIYAACSDGWVAKSIDNGASYDVVTRLPLQTTATNANPAYRPNISIHFISPLVGIVGCIDRVWKTIDGGSSWFEPTGGNFVIASSFTPGQIKGIHMSADEQVITLVGYGHIFRSTDGGVTYSIVYTFLGGEGLHLTWLNDNELWATAKFNQIVKSTDGGATWLVIKPYDGTPGSSNIYGAHFFTSTKGFYTESGTTNGNNIVYSTNSGISGTATPTGFVVTAVWTNYVPDCYSLTNCDDPDDFFIVNTDLTDYVNKVIKICPDNLPSAATAPNGGTPIIIPENDPGNSLYILTNCCNNSIKKIVTRNLTAYDGRTIIVPSLGTGICWKVTKGSEPNVPNLGYIDLTGGVFFNDCTDCTELNTCPEDIPVIEKCTCYNVDITPDCSGGIPLLNILPPYEDCDACRKCYQLTDCQNDNNIKIVKNDLSGYVGLVIKIEGCPDTCWLISEAANCNGSETIANTVDLFEDCTACLPPVVPVPLPNPILQRQVVPGYTTNGCPPEYVEKVLCRFSDQMYRIMKEKRYGIATCCEDELEKWSIKKELLSLDIINDPNPPKPDCYCYTITQNTGTNDFKYIDCTGNCQIVTVADGSSLKVCAMYFPTVICPTTNLDFTIVKSELLCTTASDCIEPIIPCICYRLDGSDYIYKYVDCDGVTKFDHSTNLLFICAKKDSVKILYGEVDVFTEETPCTNNEDCQPVVCYCYEITANGIDTEFDWLDCLGEPQSASFKSGTQYICAREGSVTTNIGTIVNSFEFCAVDAQCQPLPCTCYKIEVVGTGVTTLFYASCGNVATTHPVLNSDTLYVCVEGPAPVKQGGNGTVTVTPLGSDCTSDLDCVPPPPCNCYSLNVTVDNVNVGYTQCDGDSTLEVFAPGYYLICTPDENSIGVTGPGTAVITPQGTICDECNVECNCYTFAVNGETLVYVTYSECTTGLYITTPVSPGQVVSFCSRTTPVAANPGDSISPIIGGACTTDCPSVTGCVNYRVDNISTDSSITVGYTDCVTGASSQVVSPGANIVICSTTYPTTTSTADTQVFYLGMCP